MATQGNFARVLVNGYELTADMMNISHDHSYKANKTMPQNVGVEQYAPGVYEPAMAFDGYKRTGQGALTAHNLLSVAGVGGALDTEFIITAMLGHNASPAAGDVALLFDGTAMEYTRNEKYDDVQSFKAKFEPRGKRMLPSNLILDNLGKGGITSPVWDDGLGAANTALGAVAVLQIYTPSGTQATGSQTFNGQPADGDSFTVNIGGTNYIFTFKTALTPTAGQVFIGATVATTAANLFAAMTGGLGSGTTYAAGTVPIPSATLTVGVPTSANVINLTSVATGTAANAYTLAKSGVNLAVSGANMSGGTVGDTITSAQLLSATSSGGSYSAFCTFTSDGTVRKAERIEIPVGTIMNGFIKAVIATSGSNNNIGINIVYGRYWQQ